MVRQSWRDRDERAQVAALSLHMDVHARWSSLHPCLHYHFSVHGPIVKTHFHSGWVISSYFRLQFLCVSDSFKTLWECQMLVLFFRPNFMPKSGFTRLWKHCWQGHWNWRYLHIQMKPAKLDSVLNSLFSGLGRLLWWWWWRWVGGGGGKGVHTV